MDALDQTAIVERLRAAVMSAGGPSRVAEISGVPLRTLAGHIAGRSEPKLSTAMQIAEACGVSLEWLAYGGEPPVGDQVVVIGRIIGRLPKEGLD